MKTWSGSLIKLRLKAAVVALIVATTTPAAATWHPFNWFYQEPNPYRVAVAPVKASWYQSGTRTANGEHFNPDGLTAAHRTLAFGTRVRVCRARCVIVRINDRGPFVAGRSLDLARGAAHAVGLSGVGTVTMEVLR